MSARFSILNFYKELESSLATSTGEQRKTWTQTIVEKNIDLHELSGLLKCEKKAATRFLWLLSDIGISDPEKLFAALPFLMRVLDDLDPVYKTSFANWWLIAGIPPEQEGEAIDLSFHWLQSSATNVTIKSRAIWVLEKLTKKYPELKNELTVCLKEQMDNYSDDFRKRAVKILKQLEQ